MYVQIITDTPSVNAKAWTLMEDKIPHLLANPCIFHCINLYFAHIVKGDKSDRARPMEPVTVCNEVEAWTKVLEQWFTNKEVPRARLLVACQEMFGDKGPKRMRKYSDTRAANSFKVWHRTLRLKTCLRQAVISNPYVLWERSITDAAERARATEIKDILADEGRFHTLKDLVSFTTPVYKLLRLVDGFTPAVGKVYYKSMKIDLDMRASAEQAGWDSWQADLYRFWVNDWGYYHCDLHSLGYCVDPEYHHLMDDMPPEVWEEFVRCATRMLKAAPSDAFLNIQELLREYSDYQNFRGSFSRDVLALAKDQPAHLWWQQWGKSTPSLRYVVTRALAQCVSFL